jgi:hypothetical protein
MPNNPVTEGIQKSVAELQNAQNLKARSKAAQDTANSAVVDAAAAASAAAVAAAAAAAAMAAIPVKATGAEVDAGVNDSKFATPKAMEDSAYAKEAFATAAARAMWPIGSIFHSAVSTNPATLLGFGTWAAIEERFLVGYKSGSSWAGTLGATGGAISYDLAHVHSVDVPSFTTDALTTGVEMGTGTKACAQKVHTHTVNLAAFDSASAGSATQSVLNPYRVVYIWERTA